MAQNDKIRAARDLFSVSLDLDIIDFKLNNIIDDLNDSEILNTAEEVQSVKDLKERARALRKLCESVRIEWERGK